MKLPVRLDPDLLRIVDADDETVCSIQIPDFQRARAAAERDLRRIVVALNFVRFLNTDGMEQMGALPIEEGLRLSIVPDTHFGGPRGLVRK